MEEVSGTRVVNFCELCGDEAYLHCAADSAFLCRSCDVKFHASNFLFARHIRRIICPDCKSLTRDFISGSLSPLPFRIRCCSRSCSSSTSSCCSSLDRISNSDLSSTQEGETAGKKRDGIRARRREERVKDIAKGIFVNWCDKLGINGDSRKAVVSLAFLALAVERPRARKKVILAAAFWFGVKNSRKKMTWRSLSKVEDVTGVTARTIQAVESKLAGALKLQLRRWRVDSEEGWAENDDV